MLTQNVLDYVSDLCFNAEIDGMLDGCQIDGNEVLDFDTKLAEAVDAGLVELYENRPDYLPEGLEDDLEGGLEVYLSR